MTRTAAVLAAGGISHTGWIVGFTIGAVIVVVVVALVVPILVLAHKIGQAAPLINGELVKARDNTAPLAALSTTITYATNIIAGLGRGRARLGG
jgi:fatty acid desaturase